MSQLGSGYVVDFFDLVSPQARAAMRPGHDQAHPMDTTVEEAQHDSTLSSNSLSNDFVEIRIKIEPGPGGETSSESSRNSQLERTFGNFIKQETSDDLNSILGSEEDTQIEQSDQVSVKTEAKYYNMWYACIFCSKKFYSDLPSLQAHIKRTHYHRALQILSFADSDVKRRLLEFWRQKNRSINHEQVLKARMSKRHRSSSAKTEQLRLAQSLPHLYPREQGLEAGSPSNFSKQKQFRSHRRHRFGPYDDPTLSSHRRSPMSLPSKSPAPPEVSSAKRCRSQPTAELFSHDEDRRPLVPPQQVCSASADVETSRRPTFVNLADLSGTFSGPSDSLLMLEIVPPPPSFSPPPAFAFEPVMPPPPMTPLVQIPAVVRQHSAEPEAPLHLPFRPPETQPQSKIVVKLKPKNTIQNPTPAAAAVLPEIIVCPVCRKTFTDADAHQVHASEHTSHRNEDASTMSDDDADVGLRRLLHIAETSTNKRSERTASSSSDDVIIIFPEPTVQPKKDDSSVVVDKQKVPESVRTLDRSEKAPTPASVPSSESESSKVPNNVTSQPSKVTHKSNHPVHSPVKNNSEVPKQLDIEAKQKPHSSNSQGQSLQNESCVVPKPQDVEARARSTESHISSPPDQSTKKNNNCAVPPEVLESQAQDEAILKSKPDSPSSEDLPLSSFSKTTHRPSPVTKNVHLKDAKVDSPEPTLQSNRDPSNAKIADSSSAKEKSTRERPGPSEKSVSQGIREPVTMPGYREVKDKPGTAVSSPNFRLTFAKRSREEFRQQKQFANGGKRGRKRKSSESSSRRQKKTKWSSGRQPGPSQSGQADPKPNKSGPGSDVDDKKQKCLQEIQKKFNWFQWNDFYVDGEDGNEKFSKNQTNANRNSVKVPERRFKALRLSSSEEESSRSSNDGSRVPKNSCESGKPYGSANQFDERKKVMVEFRGNSRLIQDISKTRKPSRDNQAEKSNSNREVEKSLALERSKSQGQKVPGRITESNTDEHETKDEGAQKSFDWKKRLLIGYQQEHPANKETLSEPRSEPRTEAEIKTMSLPSSMPTPTTLPILESKTERQTMLTPEPKSLPVSQPKPMPTSVPTAKPIVDPKAMPTAVPAPKPAVKSIFIQPAVPTPTPTVKPSSMPPAVPTPKPTVKPHEATSKFSQKPSSSETTSKPEHEPKPISVPEPRLMEIPGSAMKSTSGPTLEPTEKPRTMALPDPRPIPLLEPMTTSLTTLKPPLEPTSMSVTEPKIKPSSEPTSMPTSELPLKLGQEPKQMPKQDPRHEQPRQELRQDRSLQPNVVPKSVPVPATISPSTETSLDALIQETIMLELIEIEKKEKNKRIAIAKERNGQESHSKEQPEKKSNVVPPLCKDTVISLAEMSRALPTQQSVGGTSELQIIPVPSENPVRDNMRKTAVSITKVATNTFHQEHRFHSKRVVELRNYRKIAIKPTEGLTTSQGSVVGHPESQPHRCLKHQQLHQLQQQQQQQQQLQLQLQQKQQQQQRPALGPGQMFQPFQFPMTMNIPMLEPIPRRQTVFYAQHGFQQPQLPWQLQRQQQQFLRESRRQMQLLTAPQQLLFKPQHKLALMPPSPQQLQLQMLSTQQHEHLRQQQKQQQQLQLQQQPQQAPVQPALQQQLKLQQQQQPQQALMHPTHQQQQPQQPQQQLVMLQPVQWMTPAPQPVNMIVVPNPDQGQSQGQGQEKRNGAFYKSAKQFILPDDPKNSFSLAAH